MTKRETNLLKAARAMHEAILGGDFLETSALVDRLEIMTAGEVDAAIKAYSSANPPQVAS